VPTFLMCSIAAVLSIVCLFAPCSSTVVMELTASYGVGYACQTRTDAVCRTIAETSIITALSHASHWMPPDSCFFEPGSNKVS
jgi:hypothetical protein